MTDHCVNHLDRASQSVCHSCGQHFCSSCLSEGPDFCYCKAPSCELRFLEEVRQFESKLPGPGIRRQVSRFIYGYWVFFVLVAVLGVGVARELYDVQLDTKNLVASVFSGVVGFLVHRWWLTGLRRFSQGWSVWFVVWPVLMLLQATVLLYAVGSRRSTVQWVQAALCFLWALWIGRFLFSSNYRSEIQRIKAVGLAAWEIPV